MSKFTNLSVHPHAGGFYVHTTQDMTPNQYQEFIDALQEAGPDAYVVPSELPTSAEKPKQKRRSKKEMEAARAAEAAEAAEADTSGDPAASAEPEAAPATRRRKGSKKEEPEAVTLTDEDITKACSEYAKTITPATVMAVLKDDFGVETADLIADDKRQEFIDALRFEAGEIDEDGNEVGE